VIIDGYVVADFVSNLTSTADLTFVKAVNQAADRPEIAIVLTAEPNTLAERRLQRGRRRRGSWALQTELKHYQTASEALARTGVTVLRLEASLYPPEVLAAMIEVRLVAARTLRRRRT
jgi:dTMP kinase